MTAKKTTTKKGSTAGAGAGSKKSPAKANKANLMTVKKQLRRTRPTFKRHHYTRKTSLSPAWRKPRGLHNKQKDRKRGSTPWLSDGYRTPEAVRGLHISGLEIVRVTNVAELEGINAETCGVVIASVGAKRQLELLQACAQKKLRVLNHRSEERIKKLEQDFKTSTEEKARIKAEAKKKAEAKETASKKADDKAKKAEEETTVEEKQEIQDKIKEEVLTSKGQ